MRTSLKLGTAIGLALMMAAGVAGAQDAVAEPDEAIAAEREAPMLRDLLPVQIAIQQVHAPVQQSPTPVPTAKPLQVRSWVDRDSQIYNLGENVRIFAKPSKDAYVTVLVVGPSGQAAQIFPNQFQQQNFVKANQTIEVLPPNFPSRITVSGQTGAELIKVIASTSPIPVLSEQQRIAGQQGPFHMSRKVGKDLARDLQAVMTQQATSGGTTGPAAARTEWADYSKVIKSVGGQSVGTLYAPPAPAPTPSVQPASTTVPVLPAPSYSSVIQPNPAVVAPVAQSWPQPPVMPQPQQAAVGQGGLRIAVDRAAYRVGEAMQISVMSPAACNLTIMNVNAQGAARLLFPNQMQPNNAIQGGQTVTVPGLLQELSINVNGPAGMEQIVAMCDQGQPAIRTVREANGPFGHVVEPPERLRELAAVCANPASCGQQPGGIIPLPSPGVTSTGAKAVVVYPVNP